MLKFSKMDELLSSLDSIPSMMSQLRHERSDSSQNSNELNAASSSATIDPKVKSTQLMSGDRTLSAQARRLEQNLNKLATQHASSLDDVGDVAKKVRTKLQEFQQANVRSGNLTEIYAKYDTTRKGVITYDDFSDTLLKADIKLKPSQTASLAQSLDTTRSGMIQYKNIFKALQDLEETSGSKFAAAQGSARSSRRKGGNIATDAFIVPSTITTDSARNSNTSKSLMESISDQPANQVVLTSFADAVRLSQDNSVPEVKSSQGTNDETRNNKEKPLLVHTSTINGRRFGYTRDSIAPPFHRDGDAEDQVERIAIRRGLQRRHLTVDPDEPHQASHHGHGKRQMHLVDQVGELINGKPRSRSAPSRKRHPTSLMVSRSQQANEPDRPQVQLGDQSEPKDIDSARGQAIEQAPKEAHNSLRHNLLLREHGVVATEDEATVQSASDNSSYRSGKRRAKSADSKNRNRSEESQVDRLINISAMPGFENCASFLQRKRFVKGNHIPCVQMPLSFGSTDDLCVAQNSVAVQMNGNTLALKRVMSHHDPTRSGLINRDEFKKSLMQAGIHLSDYRISTLFNEYAEPVPADRGYVGYTAGHALNIKKFTDGVLHRASSTLFKHVVGPNQAQDLRRAEERSVLKKVQRATDKLTDSLLIFQHLQPMHKSHISAAQLREGLQCSGAVLNDQEFDILLSKVPVRPDGSIPIKSFQETIHKELQGGDQANYLARKQDLSAHRRYTNTFKSSDVLLQGSQNMFEKVSESRVGRTEDFKWSKLKESLRHCTREILDAYSDSEPSHGSLLRPSNSNQQQSGFVTDNALSVGELVRRLGDRGVPLIPEDRERLTQRALEFHQLHHADTKDQKSGVEPGITVQDVCSVLEIPLATTSQGKVELIDPRAMPSDGGTFVSSRASQMSHPTFSTSYYLSGEENTPHHRGNHRMRVARPHYAHQEPNKSEKFWELEQSIGVPDIMPSPMPSFREPAPIKLKPGTARLLTPLSSPGKKSQTGRRNHPAGSVDDSWLRPRDDSTNRSRVVNNNFLEDSSRNRRSSSAPPRNRLSSSSDSTESRSSRSRDRVGAANTSAMMSSLLRSDITSATPKEVNSNQSSDLNGSLAKWAGRSLSEFIGTRSVLASSSTIPVTDVTLSSRKITLRKATPQTITRRAAPFAVDY